MELSKYSPDQLFKKAKRVITEEENLWRSIPTAFPSKRLYYPEDLNQEEEEFAAALADNTSGLDHQTRKEDRWYQYGDNEKTEFCFDAVDIPSSRFTDGTYPVWYAANSREGSQAEVIYHLAKQAKHELKFCKVENAIEFHRALCKAHVRVDSAFDIRPFAHLDGVSENGPPYPFCNRVGKQARVLKSDGILTRSRRYKNTDCWAVFHKQSIKSSIVKGYWKVLVDKDSNIVLCDNERVSYNDGWMSPPEAIR